MLSKDLHESLSAMNATVMTLCEHETASIGESWNAVEKVITPRLTSEFEQLQAQTKVDFCQFSRRVIKARQYVGTVSVGGYTLDIVPKVDRRNQNARQNLLQMLVLAGLVPCIEAGLAGLDVNAMSMLDIFMTVFLRQLTLEWRRGRIFSYRKLESNRQFLRGKLIFQQQIAQNLLHPERFFTKADEFVCDVPLCRLLRSAVSSCRVLAGTEIVQRQAMELLPEFEGISELAVTKEQLRTIATTRQSERFAPVVELAKLIVSGCGPDRPGARRTFSMLFDMNVIFERMIGRLLSKVTLEQGHTTQLQDSGRALLIKDTKPQFRLRPDVVIFDRANGPFCIVDTKWKHLDLNAPHCGVDQADVYQAYAYGKEYACKRVILLFPRVDEFDPHVATYLHTPGGCDSPRIEICTVNVSHPLKGRLWGKLTDDLRQMLFANYFASHEAR